AQVRLAVRILERSEDMADSLSLARLAWVLYREVEQPTSLGATGASVCGLMASPLAAGPAAAAMALAGRSRTSPARALLLRAVEARPREAAALARRGWVVYQMGDAPLAWRLVEEAAALKPDEPAVRREVGDALVATGRLDAGRAWFEDLCQ